ncbi:MAG: hypothetical protein HYU66_25375 [Armatimonadetes bacterium]|nr:hypothetical protein [Armatimonadota bacterium]
MGTALKRLAVGGDTLGYPHTAAVKGAAEMLRELRPRAGRSRWRAFYRREEGELVVAAIGPEAQVNRRGFERAVRTALERLAEDRRLCAEAKAKAEDGSDGEALDR